MTPLRILVLHNCYQHPGGEDVVFASEKKLLQEQGHFVFEYTDSNKRIASLGAINSAAQTIWSHTSYGAVKKIIRDVQPDIAHFHNTFMLISPSAYYACADMGVRVVQTLHNYRLLCLNSYLFRGGILCEDCLGLKLPLPGLFHKCYRGSFAQSVVVMGLLGTHRLIHTWHKKIDVYISLTEFARQKFIDGGLPGEKIFVKPNFVNDVDLSRRKSVGEYALYVGRISSEKGVETLLSAWGRLQIPLKIVGDGPLMTLVQKSAGESSFIEFLGQVDHGTVVDLMQHARFLVFPSLLYEGLPMTIIEAYACGVPVIASNLMPRAELVHDSETGLLFQPGNGDDLAAKADWLWKKPGISTLMGCNARREYEEKYTPARNYQMMMDIYNRAMDGKQP